MADHAQDNDLVEQGVDALLDNPEGLRAILTDLMTSSLRLSRESEWDLEDNCKLAEEAVDYLSAYIPGL